MLALSGARRLNLGGHEMALVATQNAQAGSSWLARFCMGIRDMGVVRFASHGIRNKAWPRFPDLSRFVA